MVFLRGLAPLHEHLDALYGRVNNDWMDNAAEQLTNDRERRAQAHLRHQGVSAGDSRLAPILFRYVTLAPVRVSDAAVRRDVEH